MQFQRNAKKIFGSPLENHLYNNRPFNLSIRHWLHTKDVPELDPLIFLLIPICSGVKLFPC